jgi:hypothetical protein
VNQDRIFLLSEFDLFGWSASKTAIVHDEASGIRGDAWTRAPREPITLAPACSPLAAPLPCRSPSSHGTGCLFGVQKTQIMVNSKKRF